MSDVAPVNLHFEDSGDWYSLPEWAECFISVRKKLRTPINAKAEWSQGVIESGSFRTVID